MWEAIKEYYTAIGNKYHVNPIIFLGIHIFATPFFLLAVAWIVRSTRNNKPILIPVIVATFIFNAANIYLIIYGQNIPLWVYLILATTTIISGYFSIRNIRKKIHASSWHSIFFKALHLS